MEEPASPECPWKWSKKSKRPRTVFSPQQLLVLEKFFERKRYGTYEERKTLGARLNLEQDRVQVWLKNRRAKDRRLQRLREQKGLGTHAVPSEQGVCPPQPAPKPSPASVSEGTAFQGALGLPASPVLPATPVFPEEPVLPTRPVIPAGPQLQEDPGFPEGPVLPAATLHHEGPVFRSFPAHSLLLIFSAADSRPSSCSPACWQPTRGVQGMVHAAPAPAPAPAPGPAPAPALAADPAPDPAPDPDPDPDPEPHPDPTEATFSLQAINDGNVSPDPDLDFTELLAGLEELCSSPRPWYDFVGNSDLDLFHFLELQGSPSRP